ncbi:uncharacterized protein LOC129211146 [Grus americana]|uniref:uncharacterized protein LOC129211146 n=1 Tax=Grus americana TaxID=9117 RepID=UPI0024080267|nr:uncharacterized protein LOC129211146 [Grus americana]
MAPTHRLLLVFLLLVALHARAAWAAPWRAQGADEDADNGASWLDVDLEPLEHPGAVPAGEGDPTSQLGSRSEAPADCVVTDVPVGRAFPAPQLDAVPQAGWHRRGPPRAQYHQPEGGKKRPEPSPLLREMLDELERRHDEDADNGASWLDVDLEPLEHPGAVPAGEGDPTSQLGSRSEAPADRVVTDVPVGRAFPAPQLDAVPQAGWHRRGPPRAQYHQPEGGKKRPEPSPLLREMLDELERRHKTDREAVKKLLFPDGSSGSLPVPPDEAQATQGAGTPVLSESGEDHQASRYDFFQADSGTEQSCWGP